MYSRIQLLSIAFILSTGLNAQAIMLPGAIGNDGSGNFDGSINASAGSQQSFGRIPVVAIDGTGLTATGHVGDNSTGNSTNWLSSGTGSTTSWYKVDLGQSYELAEALFYNFNPTVSGGNTDRGVQTADIYIHDGATEPNGNNGNLTGNTFDATGWTLFAADYNFTQAPGGNNYNTPDVINFDRASTRFVAFDITQNYGDGAFVGFAEVQFFAAPPVPEPTTALLLGAGLSGLAMIRRRRSRR